MFLKHNIFTIIWAVVILILTLTPGHAMPSTGSFNIPNSDKIAHFFVFGIFAFFLIRGLTKQDDYVILKKYSIGVTALISVGFSLLIEFLQISIPGRDFELFDILANVFGIALGLSIYYFKDK